MKFPMPSGIGQVRGNQYESRLTYSDVIHTYVDPRRVPPTVEIRIVMTPSSPESKDLDPNFDDEKTGIGLVEELVGFTVSE